MSIITKIEAQKKNEDRVNIYLNEQFFMGIYKELVFTLNLKKGMEIDENVLKGLLHDEMYIKAKNKALSILSKAPQSEKNIISKLSNDFDDRIKGYFNLNIEEYEGLCELLYNALDIKEILDKYMKNLDDGTFINYIHKENEKIINNSWMKLKFEDIVSEIRKTIFK